RDNLGPKRILTDLRDGAHAALRLAEAAPQIAAKAEMLSQEFSSMAEKGLRFDPETAEAIGRSEARHSRSGRLALWAIAAILAYIAWQVS
ncbi:MAG: ubiquinone biosynthesis protein UbiB, partial [Shinella sp.]